jgi:hypothetical protein
MMSNFDDLMFGVAYVMSVFAWVLALVAAGVAVAFLRSPTPARRWLYYALWGLTIGGNAFVYSFGTVNQQHWLWRYAIMRAPNEPGVVTDFTDSLNFLTLPLLLFFFSAPLLRKLFRNRAAHLSDGTET